MSALKCFLQKPYILKYYINSNVINLQSHMNKLYFHNSSSQNAAKKTTSAAGGVMGLGKGKGKKGKLEMMQKSLLPVETDTKKLVTYVCGSNILVKGEDVKLKDDSEYPDWLWELNTGAAPKIEDLDPNTKQYWIRVRAAAMRQNNRLNKLKKF